MNKRIYLYAAILLTGILVYLAYNTASTTLCSTYTSLNGSSLSHNETEVVCFKKFPTPCRFDVLLGGFEPVHVFTNTCNQNLTSTLHYAGILDATQWAEKEANYINATSSIVIKQTVIP